MNYITTKLTPLKSYPTYQLHSFVNGIKISSDNAFKICILEVMLWIRNRFECLSSIPDILNVPMPDQYEQFRLDDLSSFELNTGFDLKSIYIPEQKLWTFSITEPDMGANIGLSTERPAVQGRTFCTDVSFCNNGDVIETGVRIMCSEPVESEEACEVFRPTFIKMIAENKKLYMKTVYPLNGTTIKADTRSSAEILAENIMNEKNDVPFILIAESGYEYEKKNEKINIIANRIPTIHEISSEKINYKYFDFGIRKFTDNIQIDFSKMENIQKPMGELQKKEAKKSKATKVKEYSTDINDEKESVKMQSVDSDRIARKLVTLAFTVNIGEKQFSILKNKTGIDINNGDILVVWKENVIEKYTYKDYINDIKEFENRFIAFMKAFPKRRNISYGNVRFCSEARLIEINISKSENITLEEKADLLQNENRQLSEMLRDCQQREADKKRFYEDIRTINKKLERLLQENERLTSEKNMLQSEYKKMSSAYSDVSRIISFYKQKVRMTANAPNEKDRICNWIENNFAETLILTQRAKNEMKKYSGAMDTALLCDGIIYLHGYSLYRMGEITDKELELYASDAGWEACFSGKEAVKLYKSEYSVKYNNVTYILEQHIKYGVKSQNLIRVYFTWDDKLRKIIIGSMPEHLHTVKC